MKIKSDFTTNSSSSSFVVKKKYLTPEQLNIISNPQEEAERLNLCEYDDPSSWNITINDDEIHGWTTLDNFDWIEFLEKIGVDMRNVECNNPHAGMLGLGEFAYEFFDRDDDFEEWLNSLDEEGEDADEN